MPPARRRLVLAALLGVALLSLANRPFPPHCHWGGSGDALRYLEWSQVLAHNGLGAFPTLVEGYLHKWVGYPSPLRWGYLATAAAVERVWSQPPDPYHPLVILSWLAGVLAIVPVGLWLRRRAPAGATVLAMLLVATSPLLRGMSKYPLPDAIQLTLTLGLFVAVAAWMRGARTWLLGLIAALTLALVSTRESGVVMLAAATAMAAFEARRGGAKGAMGVVRACWPLVAAMAAGGVAMAAVSVAVAGGVGPLVEVVRNILWGGFHASNKNITGGPYYTYVVGLVMVSPAVVMTVAIATVWLRQNGALRPLVDQVLVVTLAALALMSALPKTLRYVAAVDAGLRILAGLAVWGLWREGGRRRAACVVLLVVLLAHDEALYQVLYANDRVYDPVIKAVARALRMMP